MEIRQFVLWAKDVLKGAKLEDSLEEVANLEPTDALAVSAHKFLVYVSRFTGITCYVSIFIMLCQICLSWNKS